MCVVSCKTKTTTAVGSDSGKTHLSFTETTLNFAGVKIKLTPIT